MAKNNERVPEGDRLWDANDVAAYLKVSRSWVYHHAEDGTLPHRRIGALLRFDSAAIRAFALGVPAPAHNKLALNRADKRPSS
jgi:excisionase family DNA binding protein